MPAIQRGVIAKYVYHAYEPVDGTPFVTCLLDDKIFQIPPHEPFEMSADSNNRLLDAPWFYTHALIETYGGIFGIVEVETTRERSGITMDLEKAEEQAQRKLALNRIRHIDLWVNQQLNERVKEGKPVLPPTGFVEESIKVLNIDITQKYRLQPVGWDWRPDTRKPVDDGKSSLGYLGDVSKLQHDQLDAAEEVAVLKAELAERDDRLTRIEGALALLLEKQAERSPEVQEDLSEEVSVGEAVSTGRKRR